MDASTPSRRARRWPRLLALVVIGAVGFVWILHRGPPSAVRPSDDGGSSDVSREAPPPAAAAFEAPSSTDDGVPSPPNTLVVLVEDAVDSRPVFGAALLAAGRDDRERTLGLLSPGEVFVRTESDARGHAELHWDGSLFPSRLVVTADGFVPARLPIPPAPRRGEFVVRLARGLEIRGTVVDGIGRPVPSVTVHAAHATLPRGVASISSVPGREQASAVTDSSGAFRLGGLTDGEHWIDAHADGWRLERAARGKGVEVPAHGGVHALAGETQLRLVVLPMRFVSLRLLHGSTNDLVSSARIDVDVGVDGGLRRTSLGSFDAGIGTDAGRRPSRPGIVSGEVVCDGTETAPIAARAHIEAEGYRAADVVVPLHPTVDPLRTEGAGAGIVPADVRLEPEDAELTGTVVIDCVRAALVVTRPTTRRLAACRYTDQRSVRVAGRALEHELVEFTGLPLGECRLEVYDGISTSLPMDVVVRPASVGPVVARFPDPTGAVVVLRDASGLRLFDADVVLLLAEGRRRGAPNWKSATSFRPGPDGPESTMCALAPGAYRYAVSKRGVGDAAGEFTVTEGSISRVECVLRPIVKGEGRGR